MSGGGGCLQELAGLILLSWLVIKFGPPWLIVVLILFILWWLYCKLIGY